MKSLFTAISCTLLFPLFVSAQAQKFDLFKVRERMLNAHLQIQPLAPVVRGEFKSRPAETFFKYYMDVISPRLHMEKQKGIRYSSIRTLIDAGAYLSEEERKSWVTELESLDKFFTEHYSSEDYVNQQRRLSELAGDMKGKLPAEAREAYEFTIQQILGPQEKALSQKASQLDRAFGDVLRGIPSADRIQVIDVLINKTLADYADGKLSYHQASQTLTEAASDGRARVGYDAIQSSAQILNDLAITRTEFAKMRGHNSWAAEALASQLGYSKTFRTAFAQREFLIEVLSALGPAFKRYLQKQAHLKGVDWNEVRYEHIELLLPQGISSLEPYFAKKDIRKVWETTILENGFDRKYLKQLFLDDKNRDKKSQMTSYSQLVYEPQPSRVVFSANKMGFVFPDPKSSEWGEGLNYIVQRDTGNPLENLRLTFHEGGHGLDFLYRKEPASFYSSSAYSETASTLMEGFLRDADYLHDKAGYVDGKKPTRAQIAQALQNQTAHKVSQAIWLAFRALIDIELWDYDYTAPDARTFVQRLEQVSNEVMRLTDLPEFGNDKIPFFNSYLGTSHFYQGRVKYAGYIFAEMSALQVGEVMSDEFEKHTGRRSWVKQPGFADFFLNELASKGYKDTFPQNIEKITGRAYEPAEFLKSWVALLEPATETSSDCEAALKN